MPATPEPNPQRLAAHLHRAARAAGYELDQPRSGAIKDLAAASGIPQSTLSRVFAGEITPKTATLQPLADTLGVPVVDLLVEAGLIRRPADPPASQPASLDYTPEDAARFLELDPEDMSLFVAFVNRLRDSPSQR